MAIADDFTVTVSGDIRHVANTNHYTVWSHGDIWLFSFAFFTKKCYNTQILASRLTQIAIMRRKIDIFIFPFLQTA